MKLSLKTPEAPKGGKKRTEIKEKTADSAKGGRAINFKKNYTAKKEKSQEKCTKKDYFLQKLPSKIRAFKTKSEFKKKNLFKTKEVICTHKFIEINREVLNFLIVDIDHKKQSLSDIFQELKDRNILPTYIVFTDRGYQIGWALEHPFPLNSHFQNEIDRKNERYAKYILRKLSHLLDGDPAALRLKGLWRNPLTNPSLIFTSKKYLLNELDIYVEQFDRYKVFGPSPNQEKCYTGNLIKKLVADILLDESNIVKVEVGQRNLVLWYYAMFLAKRILKSQVSPSEKKKKFRKISSKLYDLNARLRSPLPQKEVGHIFNSVSNYFYQNRIFVGMGNYKNWSKDFKNSYMRRYRKEKGLVKESQEERKKRIIDSVVEILLSPEPAAKLFKKFGISKATFYKYKKIILNKFNLQFLFFTKLLVSLHEKDSYMERAEREILKIKFVSFFMEKFFKIKQKNTKDNKFFLLKPVCVLRQ